MLSTHNVYIPYVDGLHDKEKFNFYKKYYNDIGFNVKILDYKNENGFEYAKAINNLLKSNSESVYIVIDYVILSKFALSLSIEIALEYECMVKPANKIYMIDDVEQAESVIDSMLNDYDMSSIYYDIDKKYETWPMGNSWVVPSSARNEFTEINETLNHPLAFDFEFCYKNAAFNKIIFLQTDGYKLNPTYPNFDPNILFVYKEYLKSVMNLFGRPENVFKYKNMVLEKMDECKIEDLIFNVDRYIYSPRYM